MNITEEVSFNKEGKIERFPWLRKLFLSLVIILVATLSFGIGRLTSTAGERVPITSQTSLINPSSQTSQTQVVGSKNSDKYHYLSCPGAKQIAEKNKVTFASATTAEASGYILATNCKP